MSTDREEVFVQFLTQTERAILVHSEIDDDNYWIPKSVVEVSCGFDELEEGEAYSFMVATWFAEKEGMI